MEKTIRQKLEDIENKENVKIILAVESGSRAWGFESQDSDYDVRFVYVRKIEDYLKLENFKDVIEWQLDKVLDINGWDLKKALSLMYKSNPSIYEWLSSNIIYKNTPEANSLREISLKYFDPKKSLYHYTNMASNHYENFLLGEEVKFKKYFYALRPVLAANYVYQNKTQPPISFDELVKSQLPKELFEEVQNLLALKKSKTEFDTIKRNYKLNKFIKDNILNLQEKIKDFDVKINDWDDLNKYFLKCVLENKNILS